MSLTCLKISSLKTEQPPSNKVSRELTNEEQTAIKKLVISMCANYDRNYGCLPLDCDCLMIQKRWTGGGCKYFREAILPNDPVLMASLADNSAETRQCVKCGKTFAIIGKKAYCSTLCKRNALRTQKRDYMRKKRAARGNLPF